MFYKIVPAVCKGRAAGYLFALAALTGGCGEQASVPRYSGLVAGPDGTVRKDSSRPLPPTISFEAAERRAVGPALTVPIRVSCVREGGLLFENSEFTETYADYSAGAAVLAAARSNLEKYKELADAKVVAERDLIDARLKYAEAQRDA